MRIPMSEMTIYQQFSYMDRVRADQQSRIPSKPPGVTAFDGPAGLGAMAAASGQLAAKPAGLGGATTLDRGQLIAWQPAQQGTTLATDLARLESMLKQATL